MPDSLLQPALLGVSFFNTLLLLWLGFTVLFNAERRTWGIWLAGSGLVAGGAFFISHTAILGQLMAGAASGAEIWWRLGWIPIVISPVAWYLLMLWYCGYWDDPATALRRRHSLPLTMLLFLGGAMLVLLIVANPLPTVSEAFAYRSGREGMGGWTPVLSLLFPLYCIGCVALALDALLRPGPSLRAMGNLARRRARPWLAAASLVLLAVTLLVILLLSAVGLGAWIAGEAGATGALPVGLAWYDFAIATLLSLVILLLGRAIVAYEIFTGKVLPRGEFQRQWWRTVALALVAGLLAAGSLVLRVQLDYVLLLMTILLAFMAALFSRQAFQSRRQTIRQLRPFLASQGLFDQLRSPPPGGDPAPGDDPLGSLCRDVIGARRAALVPLGSLAPFVGSALVYPPGAPPPTIDTLPADVTASRSAYLPLDPRQHGGYAWALPISSPRGPLGLLLLGEKQAGGVYTEEEMDLARASGERLIDSLASAALARRLMSLQRQRMIEGQVLDSRTRRQLHDVVLPHLHAAMLTLSRPDTPGEAANADGMQRLAEVHRMLADLLHDLPVSAAPDFARLGLVGALRQAMRGDLGSAFDSVEWAVDPQAEAEARTLAPLLAEVVYYAACEAVRNAARHGRPPDGSLPHHLQIALAWQDGLALTVQDDGVGLPATPAEAAGTGQGLALHGTLMAVIGGSLVVESSPGAFTRVQLLVPRAAFHPAASPPPPSGV
jgi:signal transduction histidine kinase